MESRDLLGIDRYPMPAEQRADLEKLFQAARQALFLLEQVVENLDGKPLPTDRSEFYNLGMHVRAVESTAMAVMKHAGDALLWDVDTSRETRVSPRFKAMIPPSRARGS